MRLILLRPSVGQKVNNNLSLAQVLTHPDLHDILFSNISFGNLGDVSDTGGSPAVSLETSDGSMGIIGFGTPSQPDHDMMRLLSIITLCKILSGQPAPHFGVDLGLDVSTVRSMIRRVGGYLKSSKKIYYAIITIVDQTLIPEVSTNLAFWQGIGTIPFEFLLDLQYLGLCDLKEIGN
jgi:hypothetical protein